jgi:hypothetical protein
VASRSIGAAGRNGLGQDEKEKLAAIAADALARAGVG